MNKNKCAKKRKASFIETELPQRDQKGGLCYFN